MNEANFAKFSETYKQALADAVAKSPEKYACGPMVIHGNMGNVVVPAVTVETVAQRMLDTIRTKPLGVNYSGDAFRRACKRLGINATRKAIFAFLEIT